MKRALKVLAIVAGSIIALFVLALIVTPSDLPNLQAVEAIVEPVEVTDAAEPVEEVAKPAEEVVEPEISREYANAVRAAESYLRFMGFSRKGLCEQLAFEGYPEDAIEYALAEMDKNVDWSDQAYIKALSYLRFSAFSRASLVDQLLFEGFTQEQAEHGAGKAFE